VSIGLVYSGMRDGNSSVLKTMTMREGCNAKQIKKDRDPIGYAGVV